MTASLFVMLREGLEAALIVGIILGYLRKTDGAGEARWIWLGTAAAAAVSVASGALLFATVGELEGRAEQAYEAAAMLLAVAVLTWMVFWMRRQARTLGSELRSRVHGALASGSRLALASVAFVAVVREGVESSLFLFTSTQESTPVQSFAGAALGLLAAVALGVLVYRGTTRLNLRQFFTVTSLGLFAFAAYLLVGAFEELGELGVLGSEEVGEVGGFVAAAVYVAVMGALYLRNRPKPRPEVPARAGASA